MSVVACVVNGEPRDVPEHHTIADLLTESGLRLAGIAVAVDGRVVPLEDYSDISVTPGMRIEIVRAVGGG
jgi:sulfur carrier protein